MNPFLLTLRKSLVSLFKTKPPFDRGYGMAMQELEDCPDGEIEALKRHLEALSDGAFNTCREHYEYDRGVQAALNDWEAR